MCKMILLNTNDKSCIQKYREDGEIVYELHTEDFSKKLWQSQHLYCTSDEVLNIGDFYLYNKNIYQKLFSDRYF
jgi:hypothetical protein